MKSPACLQFMAAAVLAPGLAFAAADLVAPSGPAPAPASTQGAADSMQPVAHTDLLAAQAPARAQVERQSGEQVKWLYRQCSREALTGRLASGEVALCSIVYEVLLERHFAGDFDALLEWSRSP